MYQQKGLSKRDYAAIQIMAGMNACLVNSDDWPTAHDKMARNAVLQANALVAAMERMSE